LSEDSEQKPIVTYQALRQRKEQAMLTNLKQMKRAGWSLRTPGRSPCWTWILAGLVLFVPGFAPMAAQEPPASEDPPQEESGQAVPSAAQHQEMMVSLEESVRRELSVDREALLKDIRRTQDELYQTNDRVISLMQGFLGLLALLIAVLAFIGTMEYLKVKRLGETAEEEFNNALESIKKAEKISIEITRMRENLASAWGNLDKVFARLSEKTEIEKAWVVGSARPRIDPLIHAEFEDSDQLLIIGDHMGLFTDDKRTSDGFVKLAKFWRAHGDYARAILRLQRAIELDDRNSRAYQERGNTLALQVATGQISEERGNERLVDAVESIRKAKAIQRRFTSETAYALAWIYDEMREFDKAIFYYKKARDCERAEEQKGKKATKYPITYNLACSLAKKGNFNNALDELALVIDKNWEAAAEDPDFAKLKGSPEHAKRLDDLVELGRTAGRRQAV
jgi:tetratricopeptide (TPR) repeat protein